MALVATAPDLAYWNELIGNAVHEPNRTLSNLKVTRAHYLLSEALREVTGLEAGANFHTWAVWGSRKAGLTIREEGLDRAMREVSIISFCTGLLTGFLVGTILSLWLPWWIVITLSAFGGICGAATGRHWLKIGRRRAAELMLVGNHIVLEDIGGQTARFVTWFYEVEEHTDESFAEFLKGFRPGPTENGGQDLLRRAFQQYYRAALTENLDEKRQAGYFANCLAILHEHIRLQPYITGSLPWIVRRCVTYRLMRFDVGPLRLAVGDDVPCLDGLDYAECLQTLTDPELKEFLFGPNGLDRGGNKLEGTKTNDWTRLPQRMKYIVNLFRALHLHPDVVSLPYSQQQMEMVSAGRIPPGPL
ncbi:MAG TPA: hypothetical protein VKS79_17685 [Gemmataceae bacterium]|nr:hypothetical protein [Gemmataceae bacterium]